METVKIRIERDGEDRIKVTRVYEEYAYFKISDIPEDAWLREEGFIKVLDEPWNSHGYKFCMKNDGSWYCVDLKEKDLVSMGYSPVENIDYLKQGCFSEEEYGSWVHSIPVENKLVQNQNQGLSGDADETELIENECEICDENVELYECERCGKMVCLDCIADGYSVNIDICSECFSEYESLMQRNNFTV